MRSIRDLFDLARQCYAESNRVLNSDVKESLRKEGDEYMHRADELRRTEIIQGVFPSDRKLIKP
jgi:hypothetical protein